MSDEAAGERCARCGEVGEDRRTLYMACFYAMEELGIPFEQLRVKGVVRKRTGTEELDMGSFKHEIPKFETEEEAIAGGVPATERSFYTLRVCKSCRADWMKSIKSWFETRVAPAPSIGTGIFVREFGKCVEITEEEFYRRKRLSDQKTT